MKYLIVVPDGSADNYIESIGNKTPLEVANLENIDYLAARGEIGTSRTVPDGVSPGSDSANLSVMGYNPVVYLTGRSPLEAASIGVNMTESDIAFRANLVTVDPKGETEYEKFTMIDHAAGDITTEDAAKLIEIIDKEFREEYLYYYPGTGYRHCMIVDTAHPHGHTEYKCVPPHDILDQKVTDYLPKGKSAQFLIDMMKRSYEILKDHPMNKERIANGLNPANSLWIWGQGTKPKLPNLNEKYGVKGSIISAVDLIKGIGIFAGLNVLDVEGATGTIHTDYEAKVKAAIEEYENGADFVYMHIEGTDECSHQGTLEGKIQCCEYIDKRVVKPLYEYLRDCGDDFRILIIPDHRTPLSIRTHTSDPVPFVLYDSRKETEVDTSKTFCERACTSANNHFEDGYTLADYFFEKK